MGALGSASLGDQPVVGRKSVLKFLPGRLVDLCLSWGTHSGSSKCVSDVTFCPTFLFLHWEPHSARDRWIFLPCLVSLGHACDLEHIQSFLDHQQLVGIYEGSQDFLVLQISSCLVGLLLTLTFRVTEFDEAPAKDCTATFSTFL